MLSDTERRKIAELVVGLVEADGTAQPLINALPQPLRRLFTPSSNFMVMTVSAITICIDDGYSRNPSAIAEFLRNMVCLSIDGSDELTSFADRLAVRPPSRDPYDDLVLRKDLPYLDRKELRAALRRNVALQLHPILILNGPSGSGKSFTSWLIDHLVRSEPDLEHCMIKVQDGAEPPTAHEIAKDMMTNLGASASCLPPNTTNDRRWPRELANEVAVALKTKTVAQNRTWLTVLDVSGGKPISPDVAWFIHQLATSLMTGVGRDRHRIILMNFPEEALVGLEPDLDTVMLEPLSTAELMDELKKLFIQLGRDIDATELAEGILKNLPEPHENLREVGRRSSVIVRQLVR